MRRFKKIIVDKVEYKWLFRLVLQKKCGRNTEEIQKKYGRNTEEISKLNINGDTNILME